MKDLVQKLDYETFISAIALNAKKKIAFIEKHIEDYLKSGRFMFVPKFADK